MKLEKTCTVCEVTKELGSFGHDKKMADGRNLRCKECANSWAKKYKAKNKTVSIEQAQRTFRQCAKCKETKVLTDFWKKKSEPLGYRYQCKACAYIDRNSILTAEKIRGYNLRSKFGLSVSDYYKILAEQNNVCKICGSPDPKSKHMVFHVDHDHNTGKIRGLLCGNCNLALGNAKDSIVILKSMIQYLEYNLSKNTQLKVPSL